MKLQYKPRVIVVTVACFVLAQTPLLDSLAISMPTALAKTNTTRTSHKNSTGTLPPVSTQVDSLAWSVDYFDNVNLAGEPVMHDRLQDINLNWSTGSPHPQLPVDNFAVRFERILNVEPGYYQLRFAADDGIRAWLDDQLILDEWHGATGETFVVSRMLRAQKKIRIEYFEMFGAASVRFESVLVSRDAPWRADYYDNTDLTGRPIFSQPEATVAGKLTYSGSASGPVPGKTTTDGWSARWNGRFFFERGDYEFYAVADGGVRVYLNEYILIDQAAAESVNTSNIFRGIGAGSHTVTVEYLERSGPAGMQVWWTKRN